MDQDAFNEMAWRDFVLFAWSQRSSASRTAQIDEEGEVAGIPLDVYLSGAEVEIVGHVFEGGFYECRNGDIVGPMVDDGREPSFGYKAALGGAHGEEWLSDGWSRAGNRKRDLVRLAKLPLIWDGCWSSA